MPDSLGRLCLVLHGHLPYVLHHGLWPHGEAWLFEAAVETYLPLLELLDELAGDDAPIGITIGLTPILLEQLTSDHFKAGFVRYIHERIESARRDAREFASRNGGQFESLARRWEQWYQDRLAHFQKIRQDIPAAFARHAGSGLVEFLTSVATHAYLPLLLHDGSLRAELAAGAALTRKHLGVTSNGLWLPECAYRPSEENWRSPVLNQETRQRAGLETFFPNVGVDHFFVDTHLIANAQPLAVIKADGPHATHESLVFWDAKRGWGSPLDPVGVVSDPRPPSVFAFARHPRVSEQVWSGLIGYPGAAEYLEFHFKHGDHGLRYHRVTNHHVPMHQKAPYDPELIAGKVFEHADHFCKVVRETLREYTEQTGRIGTIVAPFDAELFGHWWFEGPRFLRDVILTLAHDRSVALTTTKQALKESPAEKVVRMPEGSWGEGGHHHVWLNEQTRWLWEMEYRAEDRFQRMLSDLPWRTNAPVRQMLESAARELLLLQSSDWPFVIHSGSAVDYGISRFTGHATRFDRLANVAVDIAAGQKIDPVQKTEVAEAKAHDTVLSEIDLAWWT